MAEYSARIVWQRNEQNFLDNRYSRGHRWEFDGGAVVPASASPHIVPLPYAPAPCTRWRPRSRWRSRSPCRIADATALQLRRDGITRDTTAIHAARAVEFALAPD